MAQIRLSNLNKHRVLFNRHAHIEEGFEEAAREDNDETLYVENETSQDTHYIRTETITQSYYHCHICQKIARNPLEVPCCKHWYCAYCLMTYASMSTSDPTIPDSTLRKCAFCRADFEYIGISSFLSPGHDGNYNRMRVICPLQ